MTDAALAAMAFDDASDVTHSTAYNVLNTLVDEGQIAEERAQYLKQKFKELHTRVLTIYKRDNLLLKRARQLRGELDSQRSRVQTRGEVARQDDTEIQRLKKSLIEAEKELTAAQERESVLHVEALEYDRQKQNLILEREDAVAAEEARLRPKMEALQREIKEMGGAVERLLMQQAECKERQAQLARDEEGLKAELAGFGTTLAQAKQQYVNIEHDPERARRQTQFVLRSLAAAQKELDAMENKLALQLDAMQEEEQIRSNRANDYAEAKLRLQNITNDIAAKRKTLATLNSSLEAELESKQDYQERLQELEQLIKAAALAAQQENDGAERMQQEKARCTRDFAATEQTREDLQRARQTLQEQTRLLEKACAEQEARRKEAAAQIEAARGDVAQRTRRLLKEQSKEADFVAKAEAAIEDLHAIEELMRVKRRQEEVRYGELAQLVTRRQEVTGDAAREAGRLAMAQSELNAKRAQTRELRCRHTELDRRLGAMMDTFDKIKRERSQKAAQIQAVTHKLAEVTEKIGVMRGELEVLLREFAAKEAAALQTRRQVQEVSQVCGHMRLQANTLRKRLTEAMGAGKDVKAQVMRTNADVAALEDAMAGLQRRYKEAVEQRNKTGVHLIDRNDEMSLLLEKVRAQEEALKEGTLLTNARVEEMRGLKTRLADLLHSIESCQRAIPRVKAMEDELARLNDEIEDERWRVETLEKDLTDPHNKQRWRALQPVCTIAPPDETASAPAMTTAPADTASVATAVVEKATPVAHTSPTTPTPSSAGGVAVGPEEGTQGAWSNEGPSDLYVHLQARCQDLEARVQRVNEKLREKELILQEVTELAGRIDQQAESGRAFTLALAKQVNVYKGGIRHKSREMMATISELSLFQASSIQLQQEVQRLESVVQEAESRLREGKAPFAEAEEEYERAQEANRRYAAMLQRRREEAWQAQDSPGLGQGGAAGRTTAVPRPNAYIPDDELGLPKPFGPYAPFYPTQFTVRTKGGLATTPTTSRVDHAYGNADHAPSDRSASTGDKCEPTALAEPAIAFSSALTRAPYRAQSAEDGTAETQVRLSSRHSNDGVRRAFAATQ